MFKKKVLCYSFIFIMHRIICSENNNFTYIAAGGGNVAAIYFTYNYQEDHYIQKIKESIPNDVPYKQGKVLCYNNGQPKSTNAWILFDNKLYWRGLTGKTQFQLLNDSGNAIINTIKDFWDTNEHAKDRVQFNDILAATWDGQKKLHCCVFKDPCFSKKLFLTKLQNSKTYHEDDLNTEDAANNAFDEWLYSVELSNDQQIIMPSNKKIDDSTLAIIKNHLFGNIVNATDKTMILTLQAVFNEQVSADINSYNSSEYFLAIKLKQRCNLNYDNNLSFFYYEKYIKFFYIDIVNIKNFLLSAKINNCTDATLADRSAFVNFLKELCEKNTDIITDIASTSNNMPTNAKFKIAINAHIIEQYSEKIDIKQADNKTIDNLKEEIARMTTENEALRDEICILKTKINRVTELHNQNLKITNKKTKQIISQTKQLDQVKDLDNKNIELNNENTNLKEKYIALEKSFKELQGEKNSLQEQLSSLQKNLNQVEDPNNKNIELKNENTNLKEKYIELEKLFKELQGEKNLLQEQLSSLQKNLNQVEDLNNKNIELKNENTNLKEKYIALEKSFKELQGEKNSLQEQLNQAQNLNEKVKPSQTKIENTGHVQKIKNVLFTKNTLIILLLLLLIDSKKIAFLYTFFTHAF